MAETSLLRCSRLSTQEKEPSRWSIPSVDHAIAVIRWCLVLWLSPYDSWQISKTEQVRSSVFPDGLLRNCTDFAAKAFACWLQRRDWVFKALATTSRDRCFLDDLADTARSQDDEDVIRLQEKASSLLHLGLKVAWSELGMFHLHTQWDEDIIPPT